MHNLESLNELSNSSIISDRIKAVKLLDTATKLQPKLGSCDDCRFVSKDKRSCNNFNIENCNVFTNSLFEPIIDDLEQFAFDMALKAFKESEDRIANLNDERDLLVISAIHLGIMYSFRNR